MDKKGGLIYTCGSLLPSILYYRGMRSGTVPHTLAVGLGAACEIASQEMEVGVAWLILWDENKGTTEHKI